MNAKLAELKQKIKDYASSLKEFSKEIKEIQKSGEYAGGLQYNSLKEARECRHLLIVYGFLRGIEYERIERPRKGNEPDWKLIETLTQEYEHVEENVCADA